MMKDMANTSPQQFRPNADNTRLLRDAFGKFATGVTIITAKTADGADAPHFAIHILTDQQKDICEAFAKNGHAFNEIHHTLNAHGVPLIDNCLARFECSHVATHPAGDHVIVIGQANDVTFQNGTPLAFYAGKYGTIEAA